MTYVLAWIWTHPAQVLGAYAVASVVTGAAVAMAIRHGERQKARELAPWTLRGTDGP
jgi:hypothetical protein